MSSKYLGDFNLGATICFLFNTIDPTGVPITLAGSPAVSVYKGSNTTEVTTGVTLTVDYDGRTGLHMLMIDTSSDGTFYATGNDFKCVLTAGTVYGVSQAGRELVSFSIGNRSALRPATAGRTIAVDASGLADANVVKVGPSGAGVAQTARDLGRIIKSIPGPVTLAFLSLGTNSLSFGSLTIDYCKDTFGQDVSLAGASLIGLGSGDYWVSVPAATPGCIIRAKITADTSKFDTGIFGSNVDKLVGDASSQIQSSQATAERMLRNMEVR